MRTDKLIPVLLVAVSVLAASPAAAYIGPGAGAGTIAVVLGVLAAIIMAFFAILWYPLKRLLKNRKVTKASVPPRNPSAGE
jgi:hypothetical protein